MDTNNALAELRAAFPRVIFACNVDNIQILNNAGDVVAGIVRWHTGEWVCHGQGVLTHGHGDGPDPVSAVRAWLADQPTAAFYPEPSSGKTMEVRGFVVVNAAGEYHARGASWGTYEGEWGARNAEETFDVNCEDALSRRSNAIPFTIRVPVPVDPPVLVGEVSDV